MLAKIPYIIGAALALAWFLFSESQVEYTRPPGVTAPAAPLQTSAQGVAPWSRGQYNFHPSARFELTALVLSTERYWFDSSSAISPVDLMLGWGPMSDSRILNKLEISQGGRFGYWSANPFPLSFDQLNNNSSNMHMIPSSDEIASLLKSLRRNDLIFLRGYLVSVNRPDGWHWNSSTSRTDKGDGACEVVWVEELQNVR
jgi:hypothetical protein